MILDEIVAAKRAELAGVQKETPLALLERRIAALPPPRDFATALSGDRVRLIAEVKKASPSKGVLKPDFDPVALAITYARNGAAAVSVLTESGYFQGKVEHLLAIRQASGLERIPLLRKDFIFSPYQVYEARAYGADAVLLIVAILTDTALADLYTLAAQLGMACLVEVHNRAELERAQSVGARIIGINNRDLKTFTVDLAVTEHLCPLVPAGTIVVSESGIQNRKDITRLGEVGVRAVLVGEALVTAPDIASRVRELA